MDSITIRIRGLAPLLMHSDRGVNTMDPLVKQKALLTSKRGKNKTEEDIAEIARLDWAVALYHDPKLGPYIPARNIKAMLIEAAKKTKDGGKVRSGCVLLEDKLELKYSGPRDIDGLWKDGRFTDLRTVGQMAVRVMRCRPVFLEWEMEFTVAYDAAVVDKGDILRFAETGGRMVGIGDYRPACGGDFGRFEVVDHG